MMTDPTAGERCNAYYADGPHVSEACGLPANHWPWPHSWEVQAFEDRRGDPTAGERECDADFGYPGNQPHAAHDWDASVQDRQGAPWREETFTCPGIPATPDAGEASDHDFLPVAGHPDDDECTHRSDGTDATYCGRSRAEHEHHSNCYQNTGVPDDPPADLCDCRVLRMLDAARDASGGGER